MDEELKEEARALSPRRALRLLRETSADSGWEILRLLRIEPVKRRPGRRLTLRYQAEVCRRGERGRLRTLYGKLYRGRRGARVHQALSVLRAEAPPVLRFPEPLGYHPRRRFLLLDALEGDSLADLLAGPRAGAHLANLAMGLAALHGLVCPEPASESGNAPVFRVHDALAEGDVLESARERVRVSSLPGVLRERHANASARVQERLVASARGRPRTRRRIIHRDLYPAQVVIAEGTTGLLDLDEVAAGDPELDAGNLIAHLFLDDLQRHGAVGRAPGLAESLLASYRDHLPIDEECLALYTASSFLRLASLERLSLQGRSLLGWDRLAESLIAKSEHVLA